MGVPRRIAATSPLVVEEALVEGGIGTLETLAYGDTQMSNDQTKRREKL